MNKKNTRFALNFIHNTIEGSNASFKKASVGYGEIYEELASLMAKHPTFTMEVKEPKKRSAKAKETYDGMDFQFMARYIATTENAELNMKEYEKIRSSAKAEGFSVYPKTKRWFIEKFGKNGHFDMAKANKAIYEKFCADAKSKAEAEHEEEVAAKETATATAPIVNELADAAD